MPCLMPLSGSSQIDLPDGEVLAIGREEENEIQINDGSVSSLHAYIQLQGTLLVVEDQDSSNGTKVNNKIIEQCCLVDGDILEIGNVGFEVRGPELELPESDRAQVHDLDDELDDELDMGEIPRKRINLEQLIDPVVVTILLLVATLILISRIHDVIPTP